MVRPIKRTLKTNLPIQPQLFAFKFDTDNADGYACTPGYVSVARGDADGYYDCTLPFSVEETNLISAVATVWDELPLGATSANNFRYARVVGVSGTTVTVCTYTLATTPTIANIAAAEIMVNLLIQGG